MAETKGERTMSGFAVFMRVFIISLLAIPMCHLLQFNSKMEEEEWIFLAGIFFCFLSVPILAYLLVRGIPAGRQVFFYVFTVFAFTAVVDLILGLSLDGWIDTLDFYGKEGEPYLCSGHGAFINYWDGTVHYACYLLLTYAMVAKSDCRYSGLFWSGSIINSIIVFLPGNIIGKFGGQVKMSYFLNVPYAFFPVYYIWQVFSKPNSTYSKQRSTSPAAPSLVKRPYDVVFMLGMVAIIVLSFARMFVSFKTPSSVFDGWTDIEPYLLDPTLYPLLQQVVYVVYMVPFAVGTISALRCPAGHTWLIDWAAVFAGAVAQGQFSYIGAALHPLEKFPEETWKPVPEEHLPAFWGINLIFLLPILIFVRCWAAPQHFAPAASAGKSKNN